MSLRVVNGRAYPLGRANVDTDMVISSEWLKTITREGLGKGAFAALRRDPANVFDDPMYIGAPILIAGENFGCGSSREHAAWAIADLGINVVIAPSFSDIFSGNAFKNGILTVILPMPIINRLLVDAVGGDILVDLEAQEVRAASGTYRFEIDPFRRRCLLEGLDEIALTLGDAEDIRVFEADTTMANPWLAKARSAA